MCTLCEINQTNAEAFSDQFIDILNQGSLGLLISIGHRTRLFDVMKDMGPASSIEIAESANMNERYVRAWLNALTVGGIIEMAEQGNKFHLPPKHAAFLCSAESGENKSIYTQYIPMLAMIEDKIIECFEKATGVSCCRSCMLRKSSTDSSWKSEQLASATPYLKLQFHQWETT